MLVNIPLVEANTSYKKLSDSDRGWLSGIIDGEACFAIVRKRAYYTPAFQIGLRYDDLPAIKKVKSFIGCGSIHARKPYREDLSCMCVYRVGGVKDLSEKVIPILDQCAFFSKKGVEYPLWREFIYLFLDRHESSAVFKRMTEIRVQIHRIRHMQCLGFIPKEVREAVDTHDDPCPTWLLEGE